MNSPFDTLARDCELSADAEHQLRQSGFVVMPGPVPPDRLAALAAAYDATVASVAAQDIRVADYEGQVLACGPAGSMIIFNGSVWHGHTANSSGKPRRSIQGAYIRREAQASANLPGRMTPATLARISPLAKLLLGV